MTWTKLIVLIFIFISVLSNKIAASPLLPTLKAVEYSLFFSAGVFGADWFWSIEVRNHHLLTLQLLRDTRRGYIIKWKKELSGSYLPVRYNVPRWTYAGHPILLFQRQCGGVCAIMTVVGVGKHGPVILQQLESGQFDLSYVTSEDGNGDLRSINGDMPMTYHCFDWIATKSRFAERGCKTLVNQPETQQ